VVVGKEFFFIDSISREELIKNKKTTGRPKDIIDLENLDSTS
jgi:hypothetical protein